MKVTPAMKLKSAKLKTEGNAIMNELIKAMRPYANDYRLFRAVGKARAFISNQNDFINAILEDK